MLKIAMDPFTQGVLGASTAQSFSKSKESWQSFTLGWLAGMAPDLDILIQSSTDPLLSLEYHRHFTHSLFFVPFGTAIVALIFWFILRKRFTFKRIYFFCFLGYATHGLLDACTSYGTLLYWPLSNYRESFGLLSIIDPIYTGLLVVGSFTALITKKMKWARYGLAASLMYIAFSFYQHQAAFKIQKNLAESRGHTQIERQIVKNTLFNSLLWRSIYLYKNRLYVDAIWTLPFTSTKIYEGSSVEKFNLSDLQGKIPKDSIQWNDILRFQWFSSDYLSFIDENKNILGDMRYGLSPQSIKPMWGIRLYPEDPRRHIKRENFYQDRNQALKTLFEMLLKKDIQYGP